MKLKPILPYNNQKIKSIIVIEATVRSPFITYSSQNPCNFLDMEVIMIKEDDKVPFVLVVRSLTARRKKCCRTSSSLKMAFKL